MKMKLTSSSDILELICSIRAKLMVGSLILCILTFFVSGCCGRFSPSFLLTLNSRDKAVKKVVNEWGNALKNKDKEAYLAAVDKDSSSYYQAQGEMFDNLVEVPFSQVVMKADTNSGLGWNVTELGEDFIVKVSMNYVLEGGAPKSSMPIERFMIFEEKSGTWKAKRDVTDDVAEEPLPKDILGFGKLKAISTNHFVILFSLGEEQIAQEISYQADNNFSQIAASFTTAPKYKIPMKISDDYEDIVDLFGEMSEATPWASAMASGIWSDPPKYQIVINQENYNVISSEQKEGTIAHETVHIITAPLIEKETPPFLVEGVAEYFSGHGDMSYLKSVLGEGGTSVTLGDLIEPESISQLQSERGYGVAYEASYAAVALIEEKYGHQAFLQLLEGFKEAEKQDDQEALVDQVFQDTLGVSWETFKADWREYVSDSS